MELKQLLANAIQNGHSDELLTAVGAAYGEVMERNFANRKLNREELLKRNEKLGEIAAKIFIIRNEARKE